jgi:hypothetical protein
MAKTYGYANIGKNCKKPHKNLASGSDTYQHIRRMIQKQLNATTR